MHGSIVRRHTGKALGHREILCNGGEFVVPHPCLRDSGLLGTERPSIRRHPAKVVDFVSLWAYQGTYAPGSPPTRNAQS